MGEAPVPGPGRAPVLEVSLDRPWERTVVQAANAPEPPDPGPVADWYRELVDASTDGLLVTDQEGRILTVSDRLLELTGWSRDEVVGRSVEVLVPGPQRGVHRTRRRAFTATPHARLMAAGPDLRLLRKDGRLLPVEIALTPLRTDRTTRVAATVRDISRRVAAEQARNRLLELLDLVPDAVVAVDTATMRVDYLNHAAADLVGVPAAELVGAPVEDLRAVLDVVPDPPGPPGLEGPGTATATHRGTGERVPLELNRRVVEYGDGSRRLVVVGRDRRDRLEQEERIRRSEQAFRTTFAQAPTGVLVLGPTPDGPRTIVMANEAAAAVVGVEVLDLIGADPDDFALPEDRPAVPADGEEADPAATRPTRFRRPDGSVVWAEVRVTPIGLPGVAGPLWLAHLVDVTERETLQAGRDRDARLTEYLAEVATAALAGVGERDVLAVVVRAAADVLEGDTALVGLGDDHAGRLRVEAALGAPLATLLDTEVDVDDDPELARLVRSEAVALAASPAALRPVAAGLGPLAVARYGPSTEPRAGLLAVARAPGGARFTDDDLARLARLAAQTRLSIHLARARVDQERLVLLEERHRIARDLHDGVTQDLIALGMEIFTESRQAEDRLLRDRGEDRVARLEEATRQLRRVVFELAPSSERPLGDALPDLAREAERVLGHLPEVVLTGDVGAVPNDVVEDVVRVAREALSNVARHAEATSSRVSLEVVDGSLTLRVEDDGTGVPAVPARGYGLANIEHRAALRQGTTTLESRVSRGARLVWSCPLPSEGRTGDRSTAD